MAAALGCRRVHVKLAVEPNALRATTMACTGIRFCKLALAETKYRPSAIAGNGRDAVLPRTPNELVC